MLRDGGRRLTLAMPAGGGKTTVAASGLSQAQPTAKTLLLVPDAAALRDVIKTWSLHCNNPIATLKVVAVGQGSTAALATARDIAVWMATQQGGAILVACHDDAEVIASSHLDHQLPPWDQMVIEEAHRTAAEPVSADHPYAAIHYDDAIPAFARLYLTATPQILPTPTARDGEVGDGSVDMPGNQLFGHIQSSMPRTELVRKGLLSPYRIDVLAVPDLAHFPRLRAAAIGTAHAIERHSLRRIVSIHRTRDQAQHFALQLATQMADAEINVSPGRRTSDPHSQPVVWCQCSTDPCPQDIDAVVLADASYPAFTPVPVRPRSPGVSGWPAASERTSASRAGTGGRGFSPSIQRRMRVASGAIWRWPRALPATAIRRATSPWDKPDAEIHSAKCGLPDLLAIDASPSPLSIYGAWYFRHGSRPLRYWPGEVRGTDSVQAAAARLTAFGKGKGNRMATLAPEAPWAMRLVTNRLSVGPPSYATVTLDATRRPPATPSASR
ncbi:DEAD/DEAH box helicase family protein [Streptomyces sp. NPDC102274]|uniref:DEAD/DEAH box helicase family protein n=1 Tax=Streptomyces sp. NPDC102274 TaxID=3366151 RepID=UPI0038274795